MHRHFPAHTLLPANPFGPPIHKSPQMMPRACGGLPKPLTMEKLFNIAIRTSFWSRQRRSLSRSHTWLSGEATQSSAVQAPPPHGSRVVSIATLLRDHEAPVLGKKVEPSTGSKDVPDIVTVNGWIRSNRNMKKYSFLHVADGTTSQPLQAVIPKDQFGDTKALTTGTCIQITGEWKPSPGSKQNQQAKELHYHSLKVLGTADPEVMHLSFSPGTYEGSWVENYLFV